MNKTFKSAFPEATVVVDAPLQMQRNLAELRRASGQSQPNDFLPLLAKLMPSINTATGIEAMSYDQGTLKVDALFRDEASVTELRSQIASMPGASVEASDPKEGGMSARIAIAGATR